MKPFTEKDLEQQYQNDTGENAYNDGKITRGYTRGFFNWCLDQLIIAWNKDTEKDDTKEYVLKDD